MDLGSTVLHATALLRTVAAVQTSRGNVEIHRRTLCYVNVFVKSVPAGAINVLRLESSDPVAYMLFQFRMQCGESGLQESLVRLSVLVLVTGTHSRNAWALPW